MLSRAPTRIGLTNDDIIAYQERRMAREAQQNLDMNSSQNSDKSTVENGGTTKDEDLTPAAQTRAARVKMAREQRIGIGSSRG